jgi:hypothetical protein
MCTVRRLVPQVKCLLLLSVTAVCYCCLISVDMKIFRKILLKHPNIKFNKILYIKIELLHAEEQKDS